MYIYFFWFLHSYQVIILFKNATFHYSITIILTWIAYICRHNVANINISPWLSSFTIATAPPNNSGVLLLCNIYRSIKLCRKAWPLDFDSLNWALNDVPFSWTPGRNIPNNKAYKTKQTFLILFSPLKPVKFQYKTKNLYGDFSLPKKIRLPGW